ncbi:FxSxx-COOH system tetratricopeptide repeat protein [Dactylosporangium sp. CA-092794]|uniref:FxSxx-COOH system tetratricopeptide repeat protein n=1 Tax=Dactylosporangium sp. CA-092794 TaxID=3239929 RepID=UPI003D8DAA28
MTQRDGQVITFYSYKGGTGRTMALANVAWILAASGHRVLVADWDLESPGLHRFFRPFLDRGQVATTGGTVDLLGEYEWAATQEAPGRPEDWYREYARVEKYAFSIAWDHFPPGGGLDIMLAGRHNLDYDKTVAGMDWDAFFDAGGDEFLDALRANMKARYDYVLIDSRTGLSDVADICTLHLPDVLVDCFTFSYQGIEGAADVAKRVANYDKPEPRARSRRVLPVPMRVGDGETFKVDAGRAFARRQFGPLPSGMTDDERRDYWFTVEVPYREFYAYEEILATFGDPPGARRTLLAAYETLTGYITGDRVRSLRPMSDALRQQTMAKFNRKMQVADEVIVLRYSPADQSWAEWAQGVLTAAEVRVAEGEGALPHTASRELALVSQAYDGMDLDPDALVVLLDEARGSLSTTSDNSVSIAGEDAAGAARRLFDLVGAERTEGRQGRLPRFPGDAQQAFYVPGRNTRFTGRAELLRGLRARLRAGGPGSVVAVHGEPGTGKTQLALEYAHRFRGAYDVVWWVTAYPPQFVDVGFSDLGRELGLPSQPAIPDRVRAVRQWLDRGGAQARWLLVFDNVNEYRDIEGYLPKGNGHVIVTTREPNLSESLTTVEVGPFALVESIDHLTNRVGADRITGPEAEQVARTVANLPLFVALAGARLADPDVTVAEYLADLRRYQPVPAVGAGDAGLTPLGEEAGAVPVRRDDIEAVWDVSLGRLEADSPGAFRLLQLTSVLAPEISLDLLYGDPVARIIAGRDPAVAALLADRVSERNIAVGLVQRLNRLALIKLDQQLRLIQVHQLLQAALRKRMSDQEAAEVRQEVHRILVESRPPGEVEEPTLQQRLRILWPHLDHSDAVDSPDDDVRQLVIDRVRYIWQLGGYDQGVRYARQADRTWSAQLEAMPADDPRRRSLLVQLLNLRFNWANLLRSLGRFEESCGLSEDTLRQQEALIGPAHPHTLSTANGYGGDLRALGRYREALRRDMQTYETSVQEFGADDRQSLILANNLAASYRLMGDFRRAMELDRATYESWNRSVGGRHPRTLLSAGNLASDLREAGEYRESVDLLRTVLDGYWDLYGNRSREALMTQVNLAGALRGAGELDEAADLLDTAFHGMQEESGPSHPETGLARLARAATMQLRRETAEALTETTATEDIFVRAFGGEHPYVLACRVNRAVAAWDESRGETDREAAHTLAAAAAAALEQLLGAEHPSAMAAANNVAVFTIMLGDAQAGRAMIDDVVRRMARVLGDQHPDTIRSRGNAALSRESRDGGSASPERATVTDLLASRIGQRHPSVVAFRDGRYVRRVLDPHRY